MKQVYDEYYKICGCTRKADDCSCKKQVSPCDEKSDDFCYEILDCNDCVMERTGLSEAYVPYQTDFDIMSEQNSLAEGTVFKNLVIPYNKTMSQTMANIGRCGING